MKNHRTGFPPPRRCEDRMASLEVLDGETGVVLIRLLVRLFGVVYVGLGKNL